MVDMVVTMYELDLLPGDDVELDLQMFKGARAAADILTTTENIVIETAVPIVPNPIDAGMILGIVLTTIGMFTYLKHQHVKLCFRWINLADDQLYTND